MKLSERVRDRQTIFRDEGDVEDLRGHIIDDTQLAEIAALEAERDAAVSEANARIDELRNHCEARVAELEAAITGMLCTCIKSGSADGTTTTMRMCRRCRVLTPEEEK